MIRQGCQEGSGEEENRNKRNRKEGSGMSPIITAGGKGWIG